MAQERFPVVASEPWGRLEEVAHGVWALVSTPLQDRTTLCNGGIVAGRTGVVVIEGFASPEGAAWMLEQAAELTGRAPTHLVVTHYHADHTGGLAALVEHADVDVVVTASTRDLTLERVEAVPDAVLEDPVLLRSRRPTEIDLADRSLILVPRHGHTESDLSIQVPDVSVTFCGDLVWNGMFPNYVDTQPSRLSSEVRVIRLLGATTYVPGHGPLATPSDLDRYIDLLDDVEGAARVAMQRGMSAQEAGAEYRLPAGMEEWTLFSPDYFARAIGRWMLELE